MAQDPVNEGLSSNALMRAAYDELRALAASFFRGGRPGHTLQPTALVNEAYLRLAGRDGAGFAGRTHFFNLAARAMRQVLIDHERARQAAKRGGGAARVTLTDLGAREKSVDVDIEPLLEGLDELAKLNSRHAEVVTLRFFGGLNMDEVADSLGVSKRTVETDWQMARAWLLSRLAS